MTTARKDQISLDETPYYHCYVRCVRRAFLFGQDAETGTNYDHRKQWIVSRIRFLSTAFAIDVCAYAVMSNHYHVVLHVDKDRVQGWSQREVVQRWCELFKPTLLVERWMSAPKTLSKPETKTALETIEVWRERLYSIGWFMRCINEPIARMANKEDNCKGRFWEGRYKSQALLDEAALLTCMTYVDLNPVRAGMAESLEENDFTAVQQRLAEYGQAAFEAKRRTKWGAKCASPKSSSRQRPTKVARKRLAAQMNQQQELAEELGVTDWPQAPLMPFAAVPANTHQLGEHRPHQSDNATVSSAQLPFTLENYLQLVQETGKLCLPDKKGCLSKASITVLAECGLDAEYWVEHVIGFEQYYGVCVGGADRLFSRARSSDRAWVKGLGAVGRLYRQVK